MFADVWDGHEFVFVVAVHEVDEAFLLGEPFWVLTVLFLFEVDGAGVGEAL